MSTKYPGGFITKDAVAPTPSSAQGIWTLDQQMQAQKTGTWPFGGPFTYIEDVFSTYLYTGNGSTQTITNGIDLSGQGGLVWTKNRNVDGDFHSLFDTNRGTLNRLVTSTTFANTSIANSLQSFNSNGFSVGSSGTVNASTYNYVSWTFRKQPKFFDIVTYTGDGSALKTISHNLGSVPGCIIVKSTSSASWNWIVYHRSLGISQKIQLNLTDAAVSENGNFGGTSPTSTAFSVGYNATNESGGTYVAYLFAHNAGGFGASATDNVISCGSYTGNATAGNAVTLGYEPQWIMIKQASGSDAGTNSWSIYDNMRGMPNGSSNDNRLEANNSNAEVGFPEIAPTATGFVCEATGGRLNASGGTYIYIAIRRGPMKTPTVGTSVFAPVARTGSGTNPTVVTTGNNPDLLMSFPRTESPASYGTVFFDKLRGVSQFLQSANTNAEATTVGTFCLQSFLNTGFQTGADFIEGYLNYSGATYAQYAMTRAPGFFDEVCYTGTGSATTFAHNLTVVPELMIVKSRTVANSWLVYISALGPTKTLTLNAVSAPATSATAWNNTAPTASVFTLGSAAAINTAASTNVAYLFATLAGVSKVGNYTGTGATQTINCGFTGGARFVLIKRTDNPGAWYVWDTARGMVSGTDPSLRLNSTAAEVNANSVYAITTGFQIVTTVDDINTAGGEYIFFAIA